MTKDAKAQAATVALIVAALAAIGWKQGLFEWPDTVSGAAAFLGASRAQPEKPRDVIYAMLDAARDGVIDEYLDCYTGQMEKTLRQSRAEMGESQFSAFLKERNREIKGIAMNEPELSTEDEARVRVEYVYVERNEVQQFYLNKQNGNWKIARVSAPQRIRTPIPYGTPVY